MGLHSQTNTAGTYQQHGNRTGMCRFPTRHTEQTHCVTAPAPHGQRHFHPSASLHDVSSQTLEEHPTEVTLSSLEALRSCWQFLRHRPQGRPSSRCEMAPAPILASLGATPEQPRTERSGRTLPLEPLQDVKVSRAQAKLSWNG